MKAQRSSVLVIALLTAACSVDTVEPVARTSQAIIGGDPSEPSEFMGTGMIVTRGRLVCTATLIAADVGLTAAHCLKPPDFGSLGFTLDADASNGTENVIPIQFTHMHPDFDDRVDPYVDLAVRNDIAVFILKTPVENAPYESIDEAGSDATLDPGNTLSMCGYGWPSYTSGSFGLKRDANVLVDRTDNFEFSTAPANPQPCNGDSGAPLFLDTPSGRRIVGVVSRAMGRSEMCDTGAIITRVAPYAEWIAGASANRSEGCNAGRTGVTGSVLPLGALWALLAYRGRRRRSSPR
jgi:secreted trypsin-like serine protease